MDYPWRGDPELARSAAMTSSLCASMYSDRNLYLTCRRGETRTAISLGCQPVLLTYSRTSKTVIREPSILGVISGFDDLGFDHDSLPRLRHALFDS